MKKLSSKTRSLGAVLVLLAFIGIGSTVGMNGGSSPSDAVSAQIVSADTRETSDSSQVASSTSPVQAGSGQPDFVQATYVRDVDGDTIVVEVEGTRERVRLIGIDCPESVAPAETGKENTEEGSEASRYTKSLMAEGQTIYLASDTSDVDSYDRLLRYVWLELPDDPADADEVRSKMLNGILVDQGYAKSKRYRPDTAYNDIFDELAADAKAAGRGVSSTF